MHLPPPPQVVRRAAVQIRMSEKLRTVLALVLSVGNYMNRSNGGDVAVGFQLNFLSQVCTASQISN